MSPSPFNAKRLFGGLALAGAMLLPCPAGAQTVPRIRVGAGASANLLVGDASDFLDGAWSLFLTGDIRVDRRDILGLRVDASWGGLEADTDPLFGARAENDLFVLVAGPEVRAAVGPFRPHASALAGVAMVFWNTSVAGTGQDGSGSAFAWGGQAGLGIVLGGRAHPVALRADARVLDTGTLPFGRAPNPLDSSQPFSLIREDVAILSLRLGLTVGL